MKPMALTYFKFALSLKSKNAVDNFCLLISYVYCLRMLIFRWAGELVCGCRTQNLGLRKLRPQVELQPRHWGSARALATEQKRNVHPDLAMTHL
jgi:hypothetical protein